MPRDALLWGLTLALTGWFAGVALYTSPADVAARDALALAALYLLLSAALAFGAVGATRLLRALALPAALAIGALMAWHLREQTGAPITRGGFAGASLGLALVVALWTLAAARVRVAPRSAAAACIASLLCFALFATGVVAAYHGSNMLRWRLLRHNKMIGTPTYFALAERLHDVCEQQWADSEAGAVGDADTAWPSYEVPHTAAPHPNLVFVMLDTLRADSLQRLREPSQMPLGRDDGKPLMPLLDRWAERATIFGDVRGNSTWTRPSIASLLTGAAPEEHGATDRAFRLPEHFDLLPETLQRAGYRSAAFVSNWAAVGSDAGFDQGYDHFEELEVEPYARAGHVNKAVRAWIGSSGRLSGERPLFLYVHYLDPHTPYLEGADAKRLPKEIAASAYMREVAYLDRELRNLLEELEQRLPGETIFFVVSDHGEEFGEHAEMGHGHALYPETGRLPVLIRSPGAQPTRIDTPLEARALHGLLLDLVRDPHADPGELARRREAEVRRASIESSTPAGWHRPYQSRVCMRSAQSDGYVAIWSGYGRTVELYDLASDPDQTRNLAREQPERTRALIALLEDPEWRRARRQPVDHSDETLELLCALGYAECGDADTAGDASAH